MESKERLSPYVTEAELVRHINELVQAWEAMNSDRTNQKLQLILAERVGRLEGCLL